MDIASTFSPPITVELPQFVGTPVLPAQSRGPVNYTSFYILLPVDDGREEPKDIDFIDTALDDLRALSDDVRRDAGYQLDKVQHEEDPDD